jgi:phosphoesterase RecJ-like protein
MQSDIQQHYKTAGDCLTRFRRVLIIAHTRPDGDALGSVFGCQAILNESGISADVYLGEPVPERYTEFAPDNVIIDQDVSPADYDALLCLDCSNVARLDLPPDWIVDGMGLPVCDIDHHVDNQRYGDVVLVDPEAASTTEMLASLVQCTEALQITPDAATLLLLGLVTDTGGFRFSNTDAPALETAAWLIDHGANHEMVMHRMFFSEPLGLLKLKARLVEGLTFACDERLAYATLTRELLAECGLTEKDTEGVIDAIRIIKGVKIVCLLQQAGNDVRFSFRSNNADAPVISIAHQLNGGGHPMAAGAYMQDMTLGEAQERIIELAEEVFDG